MCTNPIQISRRNAATGQIRIYVVPCGKCEECRSFKRQEFAALSVHQAMVSGKLYFFTLTYNDDHLPVAIHDGERFIGFDSCSDREIPISWFKVGREFENQTVLHDGLWFTPSLRREDLKSWLKLFREKYTREFNERPDFKYCFFGELGEHHGRPHYHGLIYGLSPEGAKMLHDIWVSRYGFAYCLPSDYRSLELDEIGAVSNYVSKYISKGVSSRFNHLLPFIEKPRRISSRDFGSFSRDELASLRSYYDGADLHHLSHDLFCEEVLKRRSSIKINGNSFPIPLSLKQKLFYDTESRIDGTRENRADESARSVPNGSFKGKNLRSSVSLMVSKFARSQFDNILDEQFRKSSGKDVQQMASRIIRTSLIHERKVAQSREEIAQQNNLNNLKYQKDGQ